MGEIRAIVTLENRDDRGAVRLGLRAEADVRRTTAEGVVDAGAVTLVIPEEIVKAGRRARQAKRQVRHGQWILAATARGGGFPVDVISSTATHSAVCGTLPTCPAERRSGSSEPSSPQSSP